MVSPMQPGAKSSWLVHQLAAAQHRLFWNTAKEGEVGNGKLGKRDGLHSVCGHRHAVVPEWKGEARHTLEPYLPARPNDGLCNIDAGIGIVKWPLSSYALSLVFPGGEGAHPLELVGRYAHRLGRTVRGGDSVLSTRACGCPLAPPPVDPRNPQVVPCNSESPPILNRRH